MQKEFVTYEIAKKLKELDFDKPCFAIYQNKDIELELAHSINDSYFYHNTNLHSSISAPLWQQVIDWFSEIHKLTITPVYNPIENLFYSEIYDHSIFGFIKGRTNVSSPCYTQSKFMLKTNEYDTNKEALEQGILKAIELVKYEKGSC